MVTGEMIPRLIKRIADQFRSKVYVFRDSVLCLDGNVPMILRQQEFGKTIELNISLKVHHRRTHGIRTGERMEFVWKINVGKKKIEILECIEKMLGEEGGQPSQFQGRVIFMSTYSDSLWWDPQEKTRRMLRHCKACRQAR